MFDEEDFDMTQKRTWYLGMAMLLFATLTLIFRQLSETMGHLVIQHYLSLVVFAFVGMAAARCSSIRADYWMGLAYAAWYVAANIIRGDLYMKTAFLPFCIICLFALMAFPFAFVMDDGKRKAGLKLFGTIFFVCVTAFAALALLGAWRGEMIRHWLYEKAYFGIGVERRLEATNHANITAALFLSALMLGCWLMYEWKKSWMTLPWLLMSLCLYTAIALTVSRTVMFQVSFFIAAGAALLVLRHPWKKSWMKWSAFVVTGLVVLVVVFASFSLVVVGFNSLHIQTASAETATAMTAINERTSDYNATNLLTLTGRTSIFKAVIHQLCASPRALLAGFPADNWLTIARGDSGFAFQHSHNAFLQAAVVMGIPGALIAVWFALRTVWVSFRVLFLYEKRTSFGDKLLCLLLLTLLISTITEVYLFTDIQPWCSFLYFLVLGYVLESSRDLKKA